MEIWTRPPLRGCWQATMWTTCHLSARIHHFSVGDEAHKRVSAGLSETEDDASEAQEGFKPSPSERITSV